MCSLIGLASAKEECRIAVLLLPSFNAMATMALLDPFRAANWLIGTRLYRWQMLSMGGKLVVASNGLQIAETSALSTVGHQYDLVFVSSSWTPEAYR